MMEQIPQLITEIKRTVCYPADDNNFALRKPLGDVTQEDLNKQWELLNELQSRIEGVK